MKIVLFNKDTTKTELLDLGIVSPTYGELRTIYFTNTAHYFNDADATLIKEAGWAVIVE